MNMNEMFRDAETTAKNLLGRMLGDQKFVDDHWDACERIHRAIHETLEEAPMSCALGMSMDSNPISRHRVAIMDGASAYREFMISRGVDVKAIEDAAFAEADAQAEEEPEE